MITIGEGRSHHIPSHHIAFITRANTLHYDNGASHEESNGKGRARIPSK